MERTTMQTSRGKTWAGLHLAVLLAGGTGLFGRYISLSELPLVWYRILISLIVLAMLLGLTGRLKRIPRSSAAAIAGCGGILALHWVFFYGSIQASNVSVGVVCFATTGFFTAWLDPWINHRRVSVAEILISLVAIAGILLIFALDIRFRTGILLGLLSSALYALFAICNVRCAAATGAESTTMLLYELAGGIALLTLLLPLYALYRPATPLIPDRRDLAALVVLSAVFTILPYLLQIHALKHLSAFSVNITYNLEPVYSILLAALIFGEGREVGPSFWAGVALIVISVFLQTLRSLKKSA